MSNQKRADLLIVTPPPWGVDTPPLAAACLSSNLTYHGIAVDVFDLNIRLYKQVPNHCRHLWGMEDSHQWRQEKSYRAIQARIAPYLEPLMGEIISHPAKHIGFSLPTNCSDYLLVDMIRTMRNAAPEKTIILGGVSISIKAQRDALLARLRDDVDYCVVGQGEEVLLEMMKLLISDRNKRIKELTGVLTRENLHAEVQVRTVADLDVLPFPGFDNVRLSDYTTSGSLVMEFSRGCIGRCPFCGFRNISPSFQTKSAAYVVRQIHHYQQIYGTHHLSICDAAVNSNLRVLEEVCDRLIAEGIKIRISALAIPRKGMNAGRLEKMRKAGFYRLEYGVESGSNRILKKMRKIFTAQQAQEVVRATHLAGIDTVLFLMVGFPGETDSDFEATQQFLRNNANYITLIRSINPLYIMAGSELFECSERYGIQLPRNNPDSDWSIPDQKNDRALRAQRVLALKKTAAGLGIYYSEDAECSQFSMRELAGRAITLHLFSRLKQIYGRMLARWLQ
jgi:radical SAM superfamily enzyme YgiQ (UPF0313 family)